jgi:hypothetical protein
MMTGTPSGLRGTIGPIERPEARHRSMAKVKRVFLESLGRPLMTMLASAQSRSWMR